MPDTWDQVDYVACNRPSRFYDLLRSAKHSSQNGGGQKLRIAVFGSSIHTVSGGSGHFPANWFQYELFRRFGNIPETALIPPVDNTLTNDVSTGHLLQTNAQNGTTASAVSSSKLPPHYAARRATSSQNGVLTALIYTNEQSPVPELRRGGFWKQRSAISAEGLFLTADYSGESSDAEARAMWIGRETYGVSFSTTTFVSEAASSGLALDTETGVRTYTWGPVDAGTYNRIAVRIRGNGATGAAIASGARFIDTVNTWGATATFLGEGGYKASDLTTNHADMGPWLTAAGFDLAILDFGANDAFVSTVTPATYGANIEACITMLRGMMGSDFPIVLCNGFFRADNDGADYATKAGYFDEYAGVLRDIALADNNVLFANVRRLTEEAGFNAAHDGFFKSTDTAAAWDSGTSYATGDLVTYNGRTWQGVAFATNLNKTPQDRSPYWTEVRPHLSDFVHPSNRGGRLWAQALASCMFEQLGEIAREPRIIVGGVR